MSNTITCPECRAEIEVNEVMSAQLAASIRGELQVEYAEKTRKLTSERDDLSKAKELLAARQATFNEQVRAAVEQERESLATKLQAEARQAAAVEIADRDEQLVAAKTRLKEFESQELELRRKTRDLEQRAEHLELEFARRLDDERSRLQATLKSELAKKEQKLAADQQYLKSLQQELETERLNLDATAKEAVAKERAQLILKAQEEAREQLALEFQDRDAELTAAKSRLKEFESQELELRRRARELEEKAEQQELEVARMLDQERQQIRDVALKQADEQLSLKLAERDQKIEALGRQLQEAQRKLEQGSQQTQGDVQEVALETLLGEVFPNDVIERVGKGDCGGDLVHHVFDHGGRECGVILWESKRTKAWNNDWIGKAIDDQQAAKAAVACIVSSVLPKDVEHIDQRSGVWISSWSCARLIAGLLRHSLLEVAQARAATEGQNGKMELLYNYLSGDEFRTRLRGLVEPYMEMEADLQSEMRTLNARWKKRRKQLHRVMISTSGLYGDLQGIIGSALQQIEAIELLTLEASAENCAHSEQAISSEG